MNDEAPRLPLLDDPSTPHAARRLLGSAIAPSAIPERVLGAGRQALARRLGARPWRPSYALAFVTLLAGGAAVAASQSAWLQQWWRPTAPTAAPRPRVEVAVLSESETTRAAPASVASVVPPSSAVGGTSKSSSAAPAPSVAPTHDTSLEAELAALRAARAELAGNPARALTLSRGHAARFPSARLGTEAQLLEVEALVRLGKHDAAQRVGQQLLAAPGASLYRERVESLLGSRSIP